MDLLTQLMIFAAVIVALFVIAFIWEIVRRAYYWTAGKVMGWSEDEKLLRETAWLDRE